MRGRVLLAVVALLVVPATAIGQSSAADDTIGDTDRITFYGHVFNSGLGMPMPANTEAPIGESNYGIGPGAYCQNAGPTVPNAPGPLGTPLVGDLEPCEEEEGNKLVLYSTAGFVSVETRAGFQRGGAYAQLHNERGQTKDVQLDTSQKIEADVWLTMDTHGWFVGGGDTNCLHPHPENVPCVYPYWGWDPGVYENVVVEGKLYHAQLGERSNASAAPPIEEAYDNGDVTLVAEGEWGPGQVMNGLPGSPNVNRFPIDLGTPAIDSIPRSDDFFLVYSVHQEVGGNEILLDNPVRWWSGEFFPPTFTLPVQNAFTVEQVVPAFNHGKLAILGIINTPWGSYDVDAESVDLTIEDPSGQPVNPDKITRFADFSVAHGGHFKPVNITWIWDYKGSNLETGNYSVSVSATNFQHSAAAQCTAWFTLEEGAGERPVGGETGPAKCGTQSIQHHDTSEFSNQTGAQG